LIELKTSDVGAYLQLVLDDKNGSELTRLIDSISTNTTYFYREPRQFDVFRNFLTETRRSGRGDIKIWCAAASTGEEPYTILFETLEVFDPLTTTVRILASDISTRALEVASQGMYQNETVKPVPDTLRLRFMEPISLPEGDFWRVKQHLKKYILFKRFNLTKFPFKLQGSIDAIFLRNVMIYFDQPTRQAIVDEMVRMLTPGGLLFIGVTESLLGINHNLTKVDTSIFKKGKGVA
jgi:chemotaxis protein methyltransferase CheR